MNIDTLTIILGGIALLLSIISPLCSSFFCKPAVIKANTPNALPPISVVIAAHDNARELERNLPKILEQQYDAPFEVIVVDESSADDTDDVLTLLKNKYNNLYTTFIPASSHYLSRRKLALTLGVKAAHNEWVVITDACCSPVSKAWLTEIGSRCTDNTDMVLGHTRYAHNTPMFYRFYRTRAQCYAMRTAQRGWAYRLGGHNLALRKSIFMAKNGFLHNLQFLRGEYDFITNEYATPGRVATALTEDAVVIQERPSRKEWINSQLYDLSTCRHLSRSRSQHVLRAFDTAMFHLSTTVHLCLIIASALSSHWILLAIAVFCLILAYIMRALIANRAIQALGEDIPTALIPLMELRVAIHEAQMRIRYRCADKYDFIRR